MNDATNSELEKRELRNQLMGKESQVAKLQKQIEQGKIGKLCTSDRLAAERVIKMLQAAIEVSEE